MSVSYFAHFVFRKIRHLSRQIYKPDSVEPACRQTGAVIYLG